MATTSPVNLPSRPAQNAPAGFTLVEIMVALLILSIGLLGLAGMQANGLRQNNNALQRTYAMLLAQDMVERMRANPAGVSNGDYDLPGSSAPPTVANTCRGTGANCTPADIAALDLSEWWAQAAALLPSGKGKIAQDAGTGAWTVTVMWDEDRTGATGIGCGGGTTDLKCYSITFTP